MSHVVVLSAEPVTKKVRQRRVGQWLRDTGHQVTYVGMGGQKMASEALIEVQPVDQCRTFEINAARPQRVARDLAALAPDAIHVCEPDPISFLMYETFAQIDPLWLQSPELFPSLTKPAGLECPWNLDLTEYYFDCVSFGMGGGQIWARSRRLENTLGLYAHRAASSPTSSAKYLARTGHPFDVLYNSPFASAIKDLDANAIKSVVSTDKPIICYQGYATPLRLWHQAAIAAHNTGWQFVGIIEQRPSYPGYALTEQLVRDSGGIILPLAEYPHLGSSRPHLLDYLSGCHAGHNAVDLRDFTNHTYTLQNKFFEYTFAGCHIVNSPTPDATDIITKYGCGVTYNNTIEDLCAKLVELKDKPRPAPTDLIKEYAFEHINGPVLEKWYK